MECRREGCHGVLGASPRTFFLFLGAQECATHVFHVFQGTAAEIKASKNVEYLETLMLSICQP